MHIPTQPNYYEILELAQDATKEEIKQTYREMALIWHPDRYPNAPQLQARAQEKMKRINIAYGTLSNPEARNQYDASLKLNTKNTSRTQRRSSQKAEDAARSTRTANTNRPTKPPALTLEELREVTSKHANRWLKLVKIVNKLQTQFDIHVSAPSVLTQDAESVVELVHTGGYGALHDVNEDVKMKFTLLLPYVHRSIEQDIKKELQATAQVRDILTRERHHVNANLLDVRHLNDNKVEKSNLEVERWKFVIGVWTIIGAPSIFCLVMSAGPRIRVAVLITFLIWGVGVWLQVHLMHQARRNYEQAITRSEVRTKLDSQAIIQQHNTKLREFEEVLELAEN